MIKRAIFKELKNLLREYPVVVILGPRQAGKTTLAKSLKGYSYCNLESPENRHLAEQDPKAFLYQNKAPVILDEIQRAPFLLSYIQPIVDQTKRAGQFILTGSQNLYLMSSVTQSLAGRVGILNLLPFSIKELKQADIQYDSFAEYGHTGFLPRIYDQNQRALTAYSNYYKTYVERDVRQIINLKNQTLFEKFIKLLAGRVGQIMNNNSLANDVGVSARTVDHWLSILETSFIIYKLPPYFKNFGKRVTKSPKYYFMEIGLLCFLLGLQKPNHIYRDPLVGGIFENLVVIEALKSLFNQGKNSSLYFFRDSNGREIDLLYHSASRLKAFEIKSSATYQPFLAKKLSQIKKMDSSIQSAHLIYNGLNQKLSPNTGLVHFKNSSSFFT